MRIRLAQRGWACDRPAETYDELTAGIDLMWVEFVTDDGETFRTDNIGGASLKMRSGDIASLVVEMEAIGGVELVYLDADCNELGGRPADAHDLVELTYRTEHPVRGPMVIPDPDGGPGATIDL